MSKLIYVADDDRNIRDLIAGFLRSDGFETEVFENGDSLLKAFRCRPADMLILDIMMPGTDGLALCTAIRAESSVPIIIVSARDSEIDRITGITIGSDDYLVKPFSPVELVVRVKAIFRRQQADRPVKADDVLRFGDLAVNMNAREAALGGARLDLTPTELELIAYLIRNSGRAVPREELLKNVWRFDAEIDTRATDDVIKRLRKKIRDSKVRISSVWGYGFKLEIAEGQGGDPS
jgi:DNA-binding response OmpR family regulator